MTIQSRRQAINSTKLYPLDSHNGRPTHYQVQGTDHDYHVYIPEKPVKLFAGKYWTNEVKGLGNRSIPYYEYRPTCHSKESPLSFPPCQGNSNGTVCRHCLAAINDRIRRADRKVSWPKDGEFSSAVKLLNFGGELIKIVNQNGKSVWGVVR